MMKKIFPIFVLLIFILLCSNCIITARGTVPTTGKNKEQDRDAADTDFELVVIPGTYVYWLEAGNGDVFFYRGTWWRLSGSSWYKAEVHTGPWVTIDIKVVPQPVRNLPRDWKNHRNDAPHVRWNDTRHQWNQWEQDKHWEKNKWKR